MDVMAIYGHYALKVSAYAFVFVGACFYPTNIYLFQTNNRNIRKRCEVCLKLTIRTPERPH